MAFLLERAGDPLTVFDDLLGMQERFNQLFADRGGQTFSREYPPIKVWTANDAIVVDLEAPGVDPKDVDISISGAELTVTGKRARPEADRVTATHSHERFFGAFMRTLALPYRAEVAKVKATYHNGILRIQIPRAAADRPRKVTLDNE